MQVPSISPIMLQGRQASRKGVSPGACCLPARAKRQPRLHFWSGEEALNPSPVPAVSLLTRDNPKAGLSTQRFDFEWATAFRTWVCLMGFTMLLGMNTEQHWTFLYMVLCVPLHGRFRKFFQGLPKCTVMLEKLKEQSTALKQGCSFEFTIP